MGETKLRLWLNFEEYENAEYSHERFMDNYYNYGDGENYWDDSDNGDVYYSDDSIKTGVASFSSDAASNLFSNVALLPASPSFTTDEPSLTTSVYEQAKETWDAIFEEDNNDKTESLSSTSNNECCGVYPKRAPLNNNHNQHHQKHRSCCHDKRTYDSNLHSCCDDGRVVAFGSC